MMEISIKLVEYSDSDSETDKTRSMKALTKLFHLLFYTNLLLLDSPNQCYLIVVLFKIS